MSVNSAHLSDKEVSLFAQTLMDEASKNMRRKTLPVVVNTFFMNPEQLQCARHPRSIEAAVLRKMRQLSPPELAGYVRGNDRQSFRPRMDWHLEHDDQFKIYLVRPDDALSLRDALGSRTRIPSEDFVVDAQARCFGIDNLNLMSRTLEIINCIPNGGADRVREGGAHHFLQYRSMLSARHHFLAHGGEAKALKIDEAAAHVGAFTDLRIPQQYVGFTPDLQFSEVALEITYHNIFHRLADQGHTQRSFDPNGTKFTVVAPQALYAGLSNMLDDFEKQIIRGDGLNFAAFHSTISIGEADDRLTKIMLRMDDIELLQNMAHYVVFKTLEGMKTLVGENYAPGRGSGAFERVTKFLKSSYG